MWLNMSRGRLTHRIQMYVNIQRLLKKCCGSGINITDPDFSPSRMSDLGNSKNKKEEGKSEKHLLSCLFVDTISEKIRYRKKFEPFGKEL